MHEVRDVQSACMVTLAGHTPPARWEQPERWMVPTERKARKLGNANGSDEVRKLVALGRRPKAVAAVFTSDPFWTPLCCRIKCLCCLL